MEVSGITESMFNQFVEVRDSGEYNMFDPAARAETSLSKEEWVCIIKHFETLEEKFNGGEA
tara:strand:+ start:2292 stop:2474 length:183 start_codon:yes stop_codon:yes gene_type:complete